MLTPHDQMLDGLRALCEREGGYKVVAANIGVNADNLRQVLGGAKLKSGKPRSLGRAIQEAITRRYPDWLFTQHSPGGSNLSRGAVAHVLHQPAASYSPLFTWEALMTAEMLPVVFCVEMPDDSMTPRVRKGDVLEFDSRVAPRTGDGVLVRDSAGNLYFRVFRQGQPGKWEAHPLHPDFLPLSSERDGLTVAGVMMGAPRHRWG